MASLATRSSCSPDSSTISPASTTPRTLVRQACDACRVRRRKCAFDQNLGRCRDCIRLDIPCGFVVPSRTRGRKRKYPDYRSNINHEQDREGPNQPNEKLQENDFELAASNRKDERPPSSTGGLCSPSSIPPHVGHSPDASSPVIASSLQGTKAGTNRLSHNDKLDFTTDEICSRTLLHVMVTDYLYLIYPLIPIVHRPSFRRDLTANRDLEDPDFLALLIGLAALAVALLPSRFHSYGTMEPEFAMRFETRIAIINKSYDMCIRRRDPTYWDQINLRKWAVSYIFYISFLQTGQVNRSRMLEAETKQLARLLELHTVSEHGNLNCIETQLRKKAFWLMFYSYSHDTLQRRERLLYLDDRTVQQINFESLMPNEADDDSILERSIINSTPEPLDRSSRGDVDVVDSPGITLTCGFILHSRVFLMSMKDTRPGAVHELQLIQSSSAKLEELYGRLDELRYMLDDTPGPLRQWAAYHPGYDARSESAVERALVSASEQPPDGVLHGQIQTMRVNLHMTHLWLQSMLRDQIDVILQESEGQNAAAIIRESWPEREEICRQMLHLLHSIPYEYLEPNGLVLTYKIRDVAVSLLNCPFEPHEPPSRRADQFVREFTRILSRLDCSEIMNTNSLRSWIDTDREAV